MKFKQQTSKFLILSIIILVIYNALLAVVPPVSRDALTHHLFIPKLYIKKGAIYEISDLISSYYPMNLDLIYTISLWTGSDIAPKYIHMLLGLATAWLIFRYLQKTLNSNWGLAGALFFLSTPIIIHLSTTAYVDLGLTFLTTASLLTLLEWSRRPQIKLLIFAGLLAGLAAGTKYNGLISVFLLTCTIPFLVLRNSQKTTSRIAFNHALIFLGIALLALSPWLIRNYLWTSNPIYPLFQSIFNGESGHQAYNMNPLLIRKLIYDETILQTLLIPIRIFFEGQDNNPKYFDGVLNPFILVFVTLSFLPIITASPNKTDKNLFLWFSIIFILFAFVQRVIRIRYIVPVLPFLIILSILGLAGLQQQLAKRRYQHAATLLPLLLLILALLFNGIYMVRYWQKIDPLPYISGKINRDQFITRFWPEYPLILYANNNLKQSGTILAVFLGNRGYYFDRPVRFDLQSKKSLLCTLIKEHDTATKVASSLSKLGISHLLIRQDLFLQWCRQQLTKEELVKLELFFNNHTTVITTTDNNHLLELVYP